MYVVVSFEDKIAVQPDKFGREQADVLVDEIEHKYCNKVVLGVGLCVIFYDFVEVGVPHIYPGEGSTHQLVKFRMVVFRPDDEEILYGRISSCDERGVSISMHFFDNVRVERERLPSPVSYSESMREYTWHYCEDGSKQIDYKMGVGDQVRFKVLNCIFPPLIKGTMRERGASGTGEAQDGPAMKIIASLSGNDASALGCIHWWR